MKLTEERKKILVQAIEQGCTYKLAAGAAGICESTLYNWLSQGRKNRGGKQRELLEAMKQAEQRRAAVLLQRINEHSERDWKSAAWLLERRYGYRKDSILEDFPEKPKKEEVILDPKELLKKQAVDLQGAIQEANKAGSFQAYAALQRQLLGVINELNSINKEEGTELEQMTDEESLQMLENLMLSLPPVQRQRLENALLSQKTLKVVK